MALFRTEPPSAQPVTSSDAKAFARIETSDEDDLVATLIAVATEHIEAATGLALLTQKWRLTLDAWPRGGIVEIACSPVQTVDEVQVYDAGGRPSLVDLSSSVLDAKARPARLYLGTPSAPGRMLNGIEIDFTAGFGDTAADVPDALKQAILLHVARMYEFRGAVSAENQPAAIPPGYDRLIAPWRRRSL